MATAIYYASSTGNTEDIAKAINGKLGNIDIFDIANDGFKDIKNYDKFIFGISTWGSGDLQDDWENLWDDFMKIDFSNKTIALFALGDQDSYEDEFVNALGTLYEHLNENGANIIGFTSSDGYEHEESTAQIDETFVGLVIDEDNQDDLTEDRINLWIEDIKVDIL